MTKILAKKDKKRQKNSYSFAVEFDREEDGRWIAEIPAIPGALAYGDTKRAALRRVYAIALRTLADTVEGGNTPAPLLSLFAHGLARR